MSQVYTTPKPPQFEREGNELDSRNRRQPIVYFWFSLFVVYTKTTQTYEEPTDSFTRPSVSVETTSGTTGIICQPTTDLLVYLFTSSSPSSSSPFPPPSPTSCTRNEPFVYVRGSPIPATRAPVYLLLGNGQSRHPCGLLPVVSGYRDAGLSSTIHTP